MCFIGFPKVKIRRNHYFFKILVLLVLLHSSASYPWTNLNMEFLFLQYAELKPVPCVTYADAQTIREKCATPILKQVHILRCGNMICLDHNPPFSCPTAILENIWSRNDELLSLLSEGLNLRVRDLLLGTL